MKEQEDREERRSRDGGVGGGGNSFTSCNVSFIYIDFAVRPAVPIAEFLCEGHASAAPS